MFIVSPPIHLAKVKEKIRMNTGYSYDPDLLKFFHHTAAWMDLNRNTDDYSHSLYVQWGVFIKKDIQWGGEFLKEQSVIWDTFTPPNNHLFNNLFLRFTHEADRTMFRLRTNALCTRTPPNI